MSNVISQCAMKLFKFEDTSQNCVILMNFHNWMEKWKISLCKTLAEEILICRSFSLIHFKPHESAALYFHSSVANFLSCAVGAKSPFACLPKIVWETFLRFTFVSVIAFGSFFSRLVSVCGSSNSWTEFFFAAKGDSQQWIMCCEDCP